MTEIEMYGDPGDWSGSFEDDGKHMGYQLLPCPFCHSAENLEICNTHTATFWIECECGAQMHGGYHAFAQRAKTQEEARAGFMEALVWVVDQWNHRNG